MELDQTRVQDVMQSDVTTVSPGTPVDELTRVLADIGVSGLPVVDGSGRVLGVVSATDVVRLAADEIGRQGTNAWKTSVGGQRWDPAGESEESSSAPWFLPEDTRSPVLDFGSALESGPFDGYTVEDIMTPASFAVPPSASLKELAEFLVRGRIHRAIVSEGEQLVGIVTTMDILKALADR